MKNTFQNFLKLYPDNDSCLDKLFEIKSKKLQACPHCGVADAKFIRVKGRRSYRCVECACQYYPTAGTVFEKTTTPLTYWFYVIYQMTVTRNGISAKEVQRATGVTYKTAWRMANHVRRLMHQGRKKHKLTGIVEIDETFIGGVVPEDSPKFRHGKKPVMAIVQRNGEVRAYKIPNTKTKTLIPCIIKNVSPEARIMTDEYSSYKNLDNMGYNHETIRHRLKQYGRGEVYTNTAEGFFSQIKRTIYGTYIHVSPKYLQQYVNEVSFRYNNRNRQDEMFDLILSRA